MTHYELMKKLNLPMPKGMRKQKIVAEIRKKYSINDEIAILRQRDTKPQEFNAYNDYVEQCKAKFKE